MKYLTVKEVGARLRLSRSAVERRLNSGEIEKVKMGRSVRIPEASVADYEERSRQAAANANTKQAA